MRVHRDERGMVGKLAAVWLILVALVLVALVDGASIAITHFHLSSIATNAASDAAAAFRLDGSARNACEVAATTVQTADPDARFTRKGCSVNTDTGAVTIILRKEAKTLLAGRIGYTKHYAVVTDTETNGPPDV